MLNPYYGEFLLSPIPLELSLNYCSHKCAYCFANLNKPDRRADINGIFRLLANYQTRACLSAELLRRGMPVLISNKVDPFAASNFKLTLPILQTLSAMGIKVAFQTKGGKGIDEALQLVGPSCWYISISTLDDGLRRKLEPGAPSIESRFELIQKLIAAGHSVSVGVNPLVQEWLPDPSALFGRLLSIGCKKVWIETLHLNNNQTRELSERERSVLTDSLIAKACKRTPPVEVYNFFVDALETAREMGMDVMCINSPYRSDYWSDYERLYPNRFPTWQGFINRCYDTKQPGDHVTFGEFWEYVSPNLPPINKNVLDYIGATKPNIKAGERIPTDIGFKEMLAILWSDVRSTKCPIRNHAFDPAGDDETLKCRDGLPVAKFTARVLERR